MDSARELRAEWTRRCASWREAARIGGQAGGLRAGAALMERRAGDLRTAALRLRPVPPPPGCWDADGFTVAGQIRLAAMNRLLADAQRATAAAMELEAAAREMRAAAETAWFEAVLRLRGDAVVSWRMIDHRRGCVLQPPVGGEEFFAEEEGA